MTPRIRIESKAIVFARGERVRRGLRRVAPLLLILVTLTSALTEALTLFRTTSWILGVSVLLALAGGSFYLSSKSWRGRRRPGTIALSDGVLVIRRGAEEQTIRLADLEQGWLMQPSGVGLRAKDGREVLVEASRTDSEALLQGTGLDAARRVLRVSVASVASQRAGGELLSTMGLVVALPLATVTTVGLGLTIVTTLVKHPSMLVELRFLAVIAALALITVIADLSAAALVRLLRRREVVIGTDGVVVPGFVRARFVPYHAIVAVERAGLGVMLRLREGRSVLLPVRANSLGPHPLDLARDSEEMKLREVLFERIRDAMSVRAGGVASRALDELDRRGMQVAAWRERLRGLLAKEGTYRAPGIGGAELRATVADPGAPPERRVAAAVALSSSVDAEDRRQVRVAVEACADVDLRAALEEAEEGEIDERRLARLTARSGTA